MRISPPDWLWWAVSPLSALFGGLIEIRNTWYQHQFLPISRLPRPTISVGNITVGGTGKTPVVQFLAEYFRQWNKRIAILTRGYGRYSRGTLILHADNVRSFSPAATGDEPRILARRIQDGVVVVDANRVRAGKTAMTLFRPDLFLLDDAFQHRQVYRDLDIVTLSANDLLGGRRIVPAGRLREPLSQLRRADLLWITKIDPGQRNLQFLQSQMKDWVKKPTLYSAHVPRGIFNIATGEPLKDGIKNTRVMAFCGIAEPEPFAGLLHHLGAKVVATRFYRDHFPFRKKEISTLIELMRQKKAEFLITSEKDAVRIEDLDKEMTEHIFYLQIGVKILQGEEVLKKMFENKSVI